MKKLRTLPVSDRKYREIRRVAKSVGISEAELVRSAVDLYLMLDREENPPPQKGRKK